MIKFENVTKKYSKQTVIDGVSLEIKKGELVVLIGPSGCGKTTLLKMINCLVSPTSGSIFVDGKNIEDVNEISLRRNIGYVIQQTGLFPHMTIRENIELIPRLQKMNKETAYKKSLELMNMVGLDPNIFLERYPAQLSGGQQQRVGVARAFACDPEVILMDEPFSALDPITKTQLQEELADIQSKVHKTVVFVTHDMDEAVKIADKICILNKGRIVQYDTPEELMKNPINEFAEQFMGKNRIWSSPEFIRAKDIMIQDPICTSPDATALMCIEKMRTGEVDRLFVTDKSKRIMGIVHARTIRPLVDKKVKVSTIMNSEFDVFSPDDSITTILQAVNEKKLSAVPVIGDDGELQGLVTRSSLVTALSQQYLEDVEVN